MIVVKGALSTMTFRLMAFLIVVWLFTVRLIKIIKRDKKETPTFQIMYSYVAISVSLR